jgi:hypothetical protein
MLGPGGSGGFGPPGGGGGDGSPPSGEYTVPATMTHIVAGYFQNNVDISSVTIPDTVTSIGDSAFAGCTALTTVTFTGTSALHSLGKATFSGCTALTTINIPASVATLSPQLFSDCTSLTTVTFESGSQLLVLCELAFKNCTSLTGTLTFPFFVQLKWYDSFLGCSESLTPVFPYNGTVINVGTNGAVNWTIPWPVPPYAFAGSDKLKSITISQSAMEISVAAFSDCTQLATVTLVAGTDLFAIRDFAFRNCTKLGSITIPASVRFIGASAFEGASKLDTVTITNTSGALSRLESLGDSAFAGCAFLTSLALPSTLQTIGSNVFAECTSLENIYFANLMDNTPSQLTSMGDGAFSGCNALTMISIPDTVTTLGVAVFRNCSALQGINIPDALTSISDPSNNALFTGCTSLTGVYIASSYLTSAMFQGTSLIIVEFDSDLSSNVLPDNLFANQTLLAEVVFSTSPTTARIGADVFSGCSALATCVLPARTTAIGDNAFQGCAALTNEAFDKLNQSTEQVLTTLGANAFGGCVKLTSFTFYSSLTSIGNAPLNGCTKMYSVIVKSSTISSLLLQGCTPGIVEIGPAITNIPDNLFANNTVLGSVSFLDPTILTRIGENAFGGCTSLTAIDVPDCVTTIGAGAFAGCSQLSGLSLDNGASALLDISDNAFASCSSLSAVAIPNAVTRLGTGLFSGCTSLVDLVVGNGVTTLPADLVPPSVQTLTIGTAVTAIPAQLCLDNTALVTVTLGPTAVVTSIGNSAFKGCSSLTTLALPATITSFGTSVFSGCTSLSSLAIDHTGLTSIPDYTFYNCSSLTGSIKLPAGVTAIGINAFDGCTQITNIGTVPGLVSIGDMAFNRCTAITAFNIQDSVTSLGTGLFGNCTNLATVYIGNGIVNIPADLFSAGGIVTVTIGSGAVALPSRLFKEADSLTTIHFNVPSSVRTVESNVFERCAALTSLVLPSTVTRISRNAFDIFGIATRRIGCPAFTDLVITNYEAALDHLKGSTAYANSQVDDPWLGLTVHPPNFDTSSNLMGFNQAVTILATNNTSSLHQSHWTGGASTPFNTTAWAFNGPLDLRFTSPRYASDQVSDIIRSMSPFLNGRTITQIGFPVTLTSGVGLPNQASLTKVILPMVDGTTGFSVLDRLPLVGPYSSTLPITIDVGFQNCTALTSIIIPSQVTTLLASAFAGCTALTSLTLPTAVTVLPDSLCDGATALASVTVNGPVTAIGANAFRNTRISSFTITGSPLVTLGANAFTGCSNLTAFNMFSAENMVSGDPTAFTGTPYRTSVIPYVPSTATTVTPTASDVGIYWTNPSFVGGPDLNPYISSYNVHVNGTKVGSNVAAPTIAYRIPAVYGNTYQVQISCNYYAGAIVSNLSSALSYTHTVPNLALSNATATTVQLDWVTTVPTATYNVNVNGQTVATDVSGLSYVADVSFGNTYAFTISYYNGGSPQVFTNTVDFTATLFAAPAWWPYFLANKEAAMTYVNKQIADKEFPNHTKGPLFSADSMSLRLNGKVYNAGTEFAFTTPGPYYSYLALCDISDAGVSLSPTLAQVAALYTSGLSKTGGTVAGGSGGPQTYASLSKEVLTWISMDGYLSTSGLPQTQYQAQLITLIPQFINVAPTPIALSVQRGYRQAALSWAPPANGVAGLTGYNIYRNGVLDSSNNVTQPFLRTSSPPTITFSTGDIGSLDLSASYTYQVTSVNLIGIESAVSNSDAIVTQTNDGPAWWPALLTHLDAAYSSIGALVGGSPATGLFTLSAVNARFNTAAARNADISANEASFEISRSYVGTSNWNGDVYRLSFNYMDAYLTSANDVAGQTYKSALFDLIPQILNVAPSAPVLQSAAGAFGNVAVVWNPPANGAGTGTAGITGYNVRINGTLTTQTGTSYTSSTMSQTAHTFEISALNVLGMESAKRSVTVGEGALPAWWPPTAPMFAALPITVAATKADRLTAFSVGVTPSNGTTVTLQDCAAATVAALPGTNYANYFKLAWIYWDMYTSADTASQNQGTGGLIAYLPITRGYGPIVKFNDGGADEALTAIPPNYFPSDSSGGIVYAAPAPLVHSARLARIDANAFGTTMTSVSFNGGVSYTVTNGNIVLPGAPSPVTTLYTINANGPDILLPTPSVFSPTSGQIVLPSNVEYMPPNYFQTSTATSVKFQNLTDQKVLSIGPNSFPTGCAIHLGNSFNSSQVLSSFTTVTRLSSGNFFDITDYWTTATYSSNYADQTIVQYGPAFYINYESNPQLVWAATGGTPSNISTGGGDTLTFPDLYSTRFTAPFNAMQYSTYTIPTSDADPFSTLICPQLFEPKSGSQSSWPTVHYYGMQYTINPLNGTQISTYTALPAVLKLTSVKGVPDSLALPAFVRTASITRLSIPETYRFTSADLPANVNLYYGNLHWRNSVLQGVNPTNGNVSLMGGATPLSSNMFGAAAAAITSITAYNFSSSVPNNAFNGCSGLTAVNGLAIITSIGVSAFQGCAALATPLNLAPTTSFVIEKNAFKGCRRLPSVAIAASSDLTIKEGAFADCSGLTVLTISCSGVLTIDPKAFTGCTGRISVTILNNRVSASPLTFDPSVFRNLTALSVTTNGSYAMPAVSSTTLTSVTINSPTVTLAPNDLSGCSALQSVTIGTIATTTLGNLFSGCSALQTVALTFDPSANPVFDSSFNNLASLQTVSLLGSQIRLPDQIFANCPTLTSVLASNLISDVSSTSFTGCNALTDLQLYYTTSNASYSAILGQRAAQTAYTIADASYNAAYNAFAAAGEQMRLNIARITTAGQSLQDVSLNNLSVITKVSAATSSLSSAIENWSLTAAEPPIAILRRDVSDALISIQNVVSANASGAQNAVTTMQVAYGTLISALNAQGSQGLFTPFPLIGQQVSNNMISFTAVATGAASFTAQPSFSESAFLTAVNGTGVATMATNAVEIITFATSIVASTTGTAAAAAAASFLTTAQTLKTNIDATYTAILNGNAAYTALRSLGFYVGSAYPTYVTTKNILPSPQTARDTALENLQTANTALSDLLVLTDSGSLATNPTFAAPLSLGSLTSVLIVGAVTLTSPTFLSGALPTLQTLTLNSLMTGTLNLGSSATALQTLILTGPPSLLSFSGGAFPVLRTVLLNGTSAFGIREHQFANSTNLVSVNVSNLADISDCAFYGCTALESFPFQEGLLSIGNFAFANSGLTGVVTIPSTTTTLGNAYFLGCKGITDINYNCTVHFFDDPTLLQNTIVETMCKQLAQITYDISGSTVFTLGVDSSQNLIYTDSTNTDQTIDNSQLVKNLNLFYHKQRNDSLDTLLKTLMEYYEKLNSFDEFYAEVLQGLADVMAIPTSDTNYTAALRTSFTTQLNDLNPATWYKSSPIFTGNVRDLSANYIYNIITNVHEAASDAVTTCGPITSLEAVQTEINGICYPPSLSSPSTYLFYVFGQVQSAAAQLQSTVNAITAACSRPTVTLPSPPVQRTTAQSQAYIAMNTVVATAVTANTKIFSTDNLTLGTTPVPTPYTDLPSVFSLTFYPTTLNPINGISRYDASRNSLIWDTHSKIGIAETTTNFDISGQLSLSFTKNFDAKMATLLQSLYSANNTMNAINFTFNNRTTTISSLNYKSGGTVKINSDIVMIFDEAMHHLTNTTVDINAAYLYLYNEAFTDASSSTFKITMQDHSGTAFPGLNIFNRSSNITVNSNQALINKPNVTMANMRNKTLNDISGIIFAETGIQSTDTMNVEFCVYMPPGAKANTQGYPMISFQRVSTLQQYNIIGYPEEWFWCWRGDIKNTTVFDSRFKFYSGGVDPTKPDAASGGAFIPVATTFKPHLPARPAKSCFPTLNYIWPDQNDPVARNTGLTSVFAPTTITFAGTTFVRSNLDGNRASLDELLWDARGVRLQAVKCLDPDNKAATYLAKTIGSLEIVQGIVHFLIDLLIALITAAIILAVQVTTFGAGTVAIAILGPMIGAAVGAAISLLTTAADNSLTSGSFTLGDDRTVIFNNVIMGAFSGALSGIRGITVLKEANVASKEAKTLIRYNGFRNAKPPKPPAPPPAPKPPLPKPTPNKRIHIADVVDVYRPKGPVYGRSIRNLGGNPQQVRNIMKMGGGSLKDDAFKIDTKWGFTELKQNIKAARGGVLEYNDATITKILEASKANATSANKLTTAEMQAISRGEPFRPNLKVGDPDYTAVAIKFRAVLHSDVSFGSIAFIQSMYKTLGGSGTSVNDVNFYLANTPASNSYYTNSTKFTLAQLSVYEAIESLPALAAARDAAGGVTASLISVPLLEEYFTANGADIPNYIPMPSAPSTQSAESWNFTYFQNAGTNFQHKYVDRYFSGYPCAPLKAANPLLTVTDSEYVNYNYMWNNTALGAESTLGHAEINDFYESPDVVYYGYDYYSNRSRGIKVCVLGLTQGPTPDYSQHPMHDGTPVEFVVMDNAQQLNAQSELYLGTRPTLYLPSDRPGETPNYVYGGATNINIVIPENVVSIPDYAFCSTDGSDYQLPFTLKSLYIPSTLTDIGLQAFYRSGLKTLYYPDTLPSFGKLCFANTGLVNVSSYAAASKNTEYVHTLSVQLNAKTQITINGNTIAFNGFTGADISGVHIDGVGQALDVTIQPQSGTYAPPTIGGNQIYYIPYIVKPGHVITSTLTKTDSQLNIRTLVQQLRTDTTYYNNTFTLTDGVTCVFSSNPITLPYIVTSGASFGGIGNRAVRALRAHTTGAGTTIGANAFSGNGELTTFVFPSNTSGIGASAFQGTGLTSAVLPDTITDISDNAFADCSGLTEFVVPPNLVSLGDNAIPDVPNLRVVLTSVTAATNAVLSQLNESATFFVPDASVAATLAASTDVSLNITVAVPPSSPLDVSANVPNGAIDICGNVLNSNTVTLSWNPPATDGATGSITYTVSYADPDDNTTSFQQVTSPYTITNVPYRTDIAFSVFATNSLGLTGQPSAPVTLSLTPNAPIPYTNLLSDVSNEYFSYSFTLGANDTTVFLWAQTDANSAATNSIVAIYSAAEGQNLLELPANYDIFGDAQLVGSTIVFDSSLNDTTQNPTMGLTGLSPSTVYTVLARTTSRSASHTLAFGLQTYAGRTLPLTFNAAALSVLPGTYQLASNDVRLSAFTINGLPFDLSGNLTIAQNTLSPIALAVTAMDPAATIVVADLAPGVSDISTNLSVLEGSQTFSVVVTASDGVTTVTYTLIVNVTLNAVSSQTTAARDAVIGNPSAQRMAALGAFAIADLAAATDLPAATASLFTSLVSLPARTRVSIALDVALQLPTENNDLKSTFNEYLLDEGVTANVAYDLCSNLIQTFLAGIPAGDLDAAYDPASMALLVPDPAYNLIIDFKKPDLILNILPDVNYTLTATDPSGNVSTDSYTAVYTRTSVARYLTINGTAYTVNSSPLTFAFADGPSYYVDWKAFGSPIVHTGPVTTGPICFLGSAPVLTPAGYRRIDTLRKGDLVTTADGRQVAIESVQVRVAAPHVNSNPYIIPAGLYGATETLAVSPRHRVLTPNGLVAAKDLGLRQMPMRAVWRYYNLALPCWNTDNLVVAGVTTESLAPTTRLRVPLASFKRLLARFAASNPDKAKVLQLMKMCVFHADGTVETPVLRVR